LTNITTTTPPSIAVIISPAVRGPTNLTWLGGAANTGNWDTASTNWFNGTNLFTFQTGDSVLLNDAGDPNTNVNLLLSVATGSVLVSNTQQYTLTGNGGIGGTNGLTKTDTGTLTILTTNTYTGQTIVKQGVLEVFDVTTSGSGSALGAANSDPSNLVFYGSTFQYSGTTSNTDHGMTLDSTGVTMDVTNASTDLTLYGVLAGPGELTQIGPGTLTLANVNTYAGGTILNSGVLALGSDLANNNNNGGSGLGSTNSPVTFYGGALQLYGYGLSEGVNYNTVYNPLVVPAGQTGTLLMFPRGPIDTGGGAGLNSSLSGGGTLNLVANYVRDALSGNWSAFTGLINVTSKNGSGDEVRLNNSFGYSNAAIYLNASLLMDSTLTANATINIGELGGVSTAVIGQGSKSEPGPTWCVGWKNTTNTFAGTIEDDNTAPGGHTSITKVGTGTWFLAGQNTYTGSTIISNGILSLTNIGNGDGSISDSTNVVLEGGVLDVSSLTDISSTFTLNSGQTFGGVGTLTGSLDSGSGTVAPGSPLGNLHVSGAAALSNTVAMSINRNATPNCSSITASSLSVGGMLIVTNVGGDLEPGDTFTLFNGPISGAFSSIVLPPLANWNTNNLALNGTIQVVNVQYPKFSYLTLSGGLLNFNLTNGQPNAPYTLLVATNLALPLSQWTTVTNGNLDSSGSLNLTVPPDSGDTQEFYTLEMGL
jgi:autotransporter-associated beta strand protein